MNFVKLEEINNSQITNWKTNFGHYTGKPVDEADFGDKILSISAGDNRLNVYLCVRKKGPRTGREFCEQIERAHLSTVLNQLRPEMTKDEFEAVCFNI
jgi:hypothetical protein